MKHYLIIEEELWGDEIFDKEPQIIRIEVQDKKEAQSKLNELGGLIIADKVKKVFRTTRHEADGKNKPCTEENL